MTREQRLERAIREIWNIVGIRMKERKSLTKDQMMIVMMRCRNALETDQ